MSNGKSERGTWRPEHITIVKGDVALYDPDQPRDEHGRFGSTGTAAGITSARPGKSSKEVFAQMKAFDHDLHAIKGVTDAHVEPGVGAWQGGSEPSWVVSYKGNGAATKLLAETGKRYNQDAVLVMHGGGHEPSVELKFDKGVSSKARDAIGSLMQAHGIGGWTWFKSGGKTVLRAVEVPQWGGKASAHLNAMKAISAALTARGLGHSSTTDHVGVEVMEKSGAHSYDAVLSH